MSSPPFDRVAIQLSIAEHALIAAADTRNIPGEVRAAIHAAIDSVLLCHQALQLWPTIPSCTPFPSSPTAPPAPSTQT